MSRPKSAGSGTRSFLDDLLGNADDNELTRPSTSSARQRKSVRFFDDETNIEQSPSSLQQQPLETSRPRSVRPHSSTLDSLLDSTKSSTSANRSSKSDWLGISTNDDDDDNENNNSLRIKKPTINEPIKNQPPSTTTRSSSKIGTEISSSKMGSGVFGDSKNDSNDKIGGSDWITAGLKARQSRQPPSIDKKKPLFLQQKQDEPLNAIGSNVEDGLNRQSMTINRSSLQSKSDTNPDTVLSDAKKVTVGHQETAGPVYMANTVPESQTTNINYGQNSAMLIDDVSTLQQSQNFGDNLKAMINLNQKDALSNNLDVVMNNKLENSSTLAESSSSSSIIVLQTKLRILTLEKTFLEQTVGQMKQNHQDELNAMISLYEQQMRLTSEMYKRHEDMVQEERDRRIIELKSQLEKSEQELESMRNKYKERLQKIEEEYRRETKHIQETYESTTKKMIEEHENELKRLEQRLKTENDSSTQTSMDLVRNQYKSVSELMAKWEDSAFKIEKLQRTVIAKQEELVREQMLNQNLNDDVLVNKFQDIEERWKSFIDDMQKQRKELEESIKNEYEKYYLKEETKLKETQFRLDEEKNEVAKLKQNFVNEVNEWRQKESIEAEKLHNEREKLKEDVALFEEKRSLLETLYNERKKMLDDEQNRLNRQNEELIRKQTELDQRETKVKQSMLELDTLKQQWHINKIRFDQEKEQMTQMGQTLAQRAEELEKLSQMTLKEKMDSIQAMDEIERLRSEIKKESTEIENVRIQIEMDKQKLLLERNQFEQQFKILKELKETIVCNLCGSSLNSGGNAPLSMLATNSNKQSVFPNNLDSSNVNGCLFYSLINGGYLMRQQSLYANTSSRVGNVANNTKHQSWQNGGSTMGDLGGGDGDQTLLFWQMAAQQDAASLAEETKFLKIIMNNQSRK